MKRSPLKHAMLHGHASLVEFLLAKKAPASNAARDGMHPIHIAAQKGNEAAFHYLAQFRAALFDANADGATPLWLACDGGHARLVVELLARDRDKTTLNLCDKAGLSPLAAACRSGRHDVVTLLIEQRADVNLRDLRQQTLLHHAACVSVRLVADLVAKNADVSAEDADGNTPLHLACERGRREAAELLVDLCADVNSRNSAGLTPVLLAAPRGFAEVMVSMFERNARIGAVVGTWQSDPELILKRSAEAALARGGGLRGDDSEAGAVDPSGVGERWGSVMHGDAPRPGTAPQPQPPDSAGRGGRPGTAPTEASEATGGVPASTRAKAGTKR
jgi:ankyrin repeat protein